MGETKSLPTFLAGQCAIQCATVTSVLLLNETIFKRIKQNIDHPTTTFLPYNPLLSRIQPKHETAASYSYPAYICVIVNNIYVYTCSCYTGAECDSARTATKAQPEKLHRPNKGVALQESRDWRWKDHIFADDTCTIFSQITVDGKASLKPSYGRGQITKIINTKRKVNTVKKKK